jgi:DNA-binding transcriptional regulator YhcF (GntR family)
LAENHPITDLLRQRVSEATGEPVGSIIVDTVWLAVVEGLLDSGQRLPTAREVAIALGVSPRTVERAYEELEARGVVANRLGEGTSVSLRPPSDAERERRRRFAELCRETVDKAAALGYSADDLATAFAEFPSAERSAPAIGETP